MSDLSPPAIENSRRPVETNWTFSNVRWLPEALFVRRMDELCAQRLRYERFAIDDDNVDLDDLGPTLMVRRHDRGRTTVLETGGGVALLEIGRGSAAVELAAPDEAQLDELFEQLSERLGIAEQREDEVPVTFWALGHNGPRAAQRRVAAPNWAEIVDNYAQRTREAFSSLIGEPVPEAGRLILLYGEPGTGKTFALRAKIRAWSEWCSTHFITDPEAFLGSGTAYLLDVLTSGDPRDAHDNDRWKLVVLEDAGELLTVDAHERAGHALSRLLNVTDGVLGQGMKTIVLVTTNEPLGKLHPAIQRPGRCWRQIEFAPLELAAANRWLAERESSVAVTVPTTLADLFAMLSGRQVPCDAAFGFGAA